jgi:hypothetical protein
MPYVIGIVLSAGVALFARWVGFDRDRAFYPTVLMVIASYCVLFATMSELVQAVLLGQEHGEKGCSADVPSVYQGRKKVAA